MNKSKYFDIDVLQIVRSLWHRIWAIFFVAVLCGVGGFAYAAYWLSPIYQAQTLLYVNNSSFTVGSTSFSISSSELNAAQSLVATYIVILNSRETLEAVIEYAQVDYTYEELLRMVSASPVGDTEVFRVRVASEDPVEAAYLANCIAVILPDRISNVVQGSSVIIVDHAVVPQQKISPSITWYTQIGFLFGAIGMATMIVILALLDDKVRNEDYLTQTYEAPVLSIIPDMAHENNKAKYYTTEKSASYTKQRKVVYRSKKQQQQNKNTTAFIRQSIIGKNMSFAGTEAFALLRTNLLFSMSEDVPCKIIGVTSALEGEGKSTTAINTAYTIADLNKRVLLIEADMRIPVFAKLLGVSTRIGLSSVLAGLNPAEEVIRSSGIHESLDIMTAGVIPPNPNKLLSSEKMAALLQAQTKNYDFIVIDLPPVTAVSDSLIVAKLLTGMLIVVRQSYCEQRELANTMRQMEFLKVNVLGFVLNDSEVPRSKYRSYHKKYGYRPKKRLD